MGAEVITNPEARESVRRDGFEATVAVDSTGIGSGICMLFDCNAPYTRAGWPGPDTPARTLPLGRAPGVRAPDPLPGEFPRKLTPRKLTP